MADSALDLTELEKLRSTDNNNGLESSNSATESSRRWQILLEPVLFCFMLAYNLQETSLINFYLRTACSVDLNYSFSICNKGVGEEFRTAELASQVVVAGVNISKSFIGSMISTIVLLFVGPWSDCSGRRKPSLILPLVGMSATTTIILLLLIFPGATAAQVLYMVQIPSSLGGNFALLTAASYSYIGDVCHATGHDITRTMGTHRAATQFAYGVGSVCGPLLYRQLGFYGVFPLVLFLHVSALTFVVIMVKDINVKRDNKVSVFNWRLPYSAIQCLFRKREGCKRVVILLLLMIGFVDRILRTAEMLLSFMYHRYKFKWDDLMFGLFLAYKYITSFAGKIYSAFSALETAIQMLSSPLYALLYKKSVSSVPDAWLIPGIILCLIQFLLYFYTRKLGQIIHKNALIIKIDDKKVHFKNQLK